VALAPVLWHHRTRARAARRKKTGVLAVSVMFVALTVGTGACVGVSERTREDAERWVLRME
jgi:hypothetical protein